MRDAAIALLAGLFVIACGETPVAQLYGEVEVARRDIVVSAQAAGVVEPDVTVEVKSKASGEILEIRVETGDRVDQGALMVRIDQRQLRNTLAEAEAQLEVARARHRNAEAQKRRADALYREQSLSETQHDQAQLDYAISRAELVRAEIAVERARIELEDAEVLAPIGGTILEKKVERGQVISSPTRDVGGGTLLLRMADLERVRVRTLVDETDLGKIRPGLPVTVTVAAHPERPFQGSVLKVEPQSVTEQNVTMFPVLVAVQNSEALLKPGMNCEVEIFVDRADGVLAIPNAALRTRDDAVAAAAVVGLSEEEVERQLDGQGREVEAADYAVFIQSDRGPEARWIRTGLTDLDYVAVEEGLSEGERVLLLPSASLLRSQELFKKRIRGITGLPNMRGGSK